MKKTLASFILALFLLFSPTIVHAQVLGGPCQAKELNTAIGCIPIDSQTALFGFILGWSIGIAGGIAFILILIAGFQITTSAGDPKKLQAGQELLTSAISGILLLIFSVIVLKFIGVNILQIPGLST
jgi:hypothetical protein